MTSAAQGVLKLCVEAANPQVIALLSCLTHPPQSSCVSCRSYVEKESGAVTLATLRATFASKV